MKIVINGQFLARRLTGQERFALEIVKELDFIVEKNIFELIVPKFVESIPDLKNIKIIKYGNIKGTMWEQICLFDYIKKNKCMSVNLCSIMPIFAPGIICIHDISYKVNPSYFKTVYGFLSKWWHRLNFIVAWKYAPIIFTVSNFSKKQIMEVYHVAEEKIKVISNGWQHFNKIEEDASIVNKYPVVKNDFYFALGTLAKNKNIKWILNNAMLYPDRHYIISGGNGLSTYGQTYDVDNLKNVTFTGYISDGEIKYLMSHCKAFLFPSYFEGFGIPPLEALSVGSKIVVANSSCLPEIYEDAAYYINPEDSNVDLNELVKNPVGDAKKILEKYSYKKSAQEIVENLRELNYI